jgi:hypothetical protein
MGDVGDGAFSPPQSLEGAALQVRLVDGVWYRGRLVARVAGTEPPRWRVQFDDGELRDDICLGSPAAAVRFDAGAYGATVEVRFDGVWYRGRLVELLRGGEQWGVAFENGDWAEDVRLGDPDVRCVFAGRGGDGQGRRQGRGDDAGEGPRANPDGGTTTASSASQKRPARRADSSRAQRMNDKEVEEEERSEEEQETLKKRRVGEAGVAKGEMPGAGGRVTGCFECHMCGKAFSGSFSASGSLARHMLRHSGDGTYGCESCGKTLSNTSNPASHMRTHTGERPHVCETCGKAFKWSSDLALHMRTHSGEKPHVCKTCGKAFSQSGTLAAHMRTHSGEKPHVCKTCGKAFSQSGSLVVHMRKHSGERPFVCETCGKAFTTSGSLAVHMRKHSGERPFVCETCGKTFTAAHRLTAHRRTHGRGKSHVCETCGKAFIHLGKHMRACPGKP